MAEKLKLFLGKKYIFVKLYYFGVLFLNNKGNNLSLKMIKAYMISLIKEFMLVFNCKAFFLIKNIDFIHFFQKYFQIEKITSLTQMHFFTKELKTEQFTEIICFRNDPLSKFILNSLQINDLIFDTNHLY